MLEYLRRSWSDLVRCISACGDELTDEEEAIISKAEYEVFGFALVRTIEAPLAPEVKK